MMEEKILDKFKKLGYVYAVQEDKTIVLYNPMKDRTVYITENNSFAVGLGFPFFVSLIIGIPKTTPTFKEKRLIKKLIKARKENANENQINKIRKL